MLKNILKICLAMQILFLHWADCEYIYVSSHNGEDKPSCGFTEITPCETIGYTIKYLSKIADEIIIDGGKHDSLQKPYIYMLNETIEITFSMKIRKKDHSKTPVVTVKNTGEVDAIFVLKNTTIFDFHVNDINFENISSLLRSETTSHIHLLRSIIRNATNSVFMLPGNMRLMNLHLHVHECEFHHCRDVVEDNLKMITHLRFKSCKFRNFTHTIFNISFSDKIPTLNFEKLDFKQVPMAISMIKHSDLEPSVLEILDSKFEDILSTYAIETNNIRIIDIKGTVFISKHTPYTPIRFHKSKDVHFDNNKFLNHNIGIYGAVHMTNVQNLKIHNNIFSNNYATKYGSAICIINSTMNIKNSLFTNNNASIGGSIYVDNSNVVIDTCTFKDNVAGLYGGGMYATNSNITVRNTTFIENESHSDAGAVFYSVTNSKNKQEFNISNSLFLKNRADIFGGALFINGGITKTNGSKFLNNTAVLSGGAIYAESGDTESYSTAFQYNIANSSGGAIFQTGASNNLTLNNVSLITSGGDTSIVGTLIHSQNEANVENTTVSIQLSKSQSSDGLQGILFPKSKIKNLQFSCTSNYKIKYKNVKRSNGFVFVYVSCIACSRGTHSLMGSTAIFIDPSDPSSIIENQAICSDCPNGGICNNYVVSQDNFWGFVKDFNNSNKIAFIPCPPSYCCSINENECVNYNTCSNNRGGVLCGRCIKNYNIDYFTGKCIQMAMCSVMWFWILYFIYVFALSLFLMYFKDISLGIQKLLLKLFYSSDNAQSESNGNSTASTINGINVEKANVDFDLYFSGLKKIAIFYFQSANLLYVKSTSQNNLGYLGKFRAYIALVFNFDFIAIDISNFCPTRHLTVMLRVIIRSSVVLFCIVTLLIVYRLVSKLVIGRRRRLPLKIKITILDLLLIGYVVITKFAFSMVNCVDINSSSRLYISGDFVCYVWWQYFIIIFIMLWVVPFGAAVYFGNNMLRDKFINSKDFYVIILFPVSAFYFYRRKQRLRQCTSNQEVSTLNEEAREILDMFKAPFNENKTNLEVNWETVIIYRRLIITAITTFVLNPVPRLFLTFIVLFFSLQHHNIYVPFKKDLLNHSESGSLICLMLLNIINLAWAYAYMNDISTMPGAETLSITLSICQDTILVLPILALLGYLFILFISKISKKICINISTTLYEETQVVQNRNVNVMFVNLFK